MKSRRLTVAFLLAMFFFIGYVLKGYIRYCIYEERRQQYISECIAWVEEGIKKPMGWEDFPYSHKTHSEAGKGWLNSGSWSGKYFMAEYLRCQPGEPPNCFDGETKIGPFEHCPGSPDYTRYTTWVEDNRTQYAPQIMGSEDYVVVHYEPEDEGGEENEP